MLFRLYVCSPIHLEPIQPRTFRVKPAGSFFDLIERSLLTVCKFVYD